MERQTEKAWSELSSFMVVRWLPSFMPYGAHSADLVPGLHVYAGAAAIIHWAGLLVMVSVEPDLRAH